MLQFNEWLMENAPLNRRELRGDVGDKATFNAIEPAVGDMIVDNPTTFFRTKNNQELQSLIGSLFAVTQDKGKVVATRPMRVSKKKPIDVSKNDLADLSFYYPNFSKKIWLYLPQDSKYDAFRQKYEMLKKQKDPEVERAMTNKVRQELGTSTEPIQMNGYRKLEKTVHDMMLTGRGNPALELKRVFADEPRAKDPLFIRSLRKNDLNLIADYLEGKPLGSTQDELGRRMQAAQMPPAQNSKVDDVFAKAVARAKAPPPAADDLEAKWQQALQKPKSNRPQMISPQAAAWARQFEGTKYKYYPLD